MNNEDKAFAATCADVERWLYDFAEKDLAPELRQAMARHLLVCTACRVLVASYRKDSEHLKSHITADIKLPPHFRQALLHRLHAADHP